MSLNVPKCPTRAQGWAVLIPGRSLLIRAHGEGGQPAPAAKLTGHTAAEETA